MNCVSVSPCVLCLILFFVVVFFWFDCVLFVLSWCVPQHWQKTVEVVGGHWQIDNESGGVATGRWQWKWWGGKLAGSKGDSEKWWGGHWQRGQWQLVAGYWQITGKIDEESTTRVGSQTTQTANQHQQKTSTKTQEAHKTDNSTQHTNNRISKTTGPPSKKALKINSLLRRLLGIWSKVHET